MGAGVIEAGILHGHDTCQGGGWVYGDGGGPIE